MPSQIAFQNKWLVSYETLLFDTPDGDLGIGEYALDGSVGYFIRTVPKNQGHIEYAPLSYNVSGKTLVQIVPGGLAYYDEFLTAVGQTLEAQGVHNRPLGSLFRRPSSAALYNPLRTVKNAPQPSRTENVDVLPQPLPKDGPPEHHSIALDSTSNSGAKVGVSSYTWNHTCTGANGLLVAQHSHCSGTDRTVSTITYNAVGLTSARGDYVNDVSNARHNRTYIYYLLAPTTGSALTMSVTLSGALSGDAGQTTAVSVSGGKQSAQPDAVNGSNNTTANPSVAVTTVADNCWVFAALAVYSGVSACAQTQRYNPYFGLIVTSDTNGPKTPAGSQTMSWTAAAEDWCMSVASFSPAAAAPSVPKSVSPVAKLIAAGAL